MPLNSALRAKLPELVPHGLVVTRTWLVQQGVSRHSLDNLVKSNQLYPLVRGVYKRPETQLTWQGIVASLQRLGHDFAIGGLSALEVHGLNHHIPLGKERPIRLYGPDPLPKWSKKLGISEYFIWHSASRLWRPKPQTQHSLRFTMDRTWGHQPYVMKVSRPERAIFEVLESVPAGISFEHADQLMQSMSLLSSDRLDVILRQIKHVKVKRLFFWFAARQNHDWLKKLDVNHYDLGAGKRVVEPGGKLDKKYQITVNDQIDGYY